MFLVSFSVHIFWFSIVWGHLSSYLIVFCSYCHLCLIVYFFGPFYSVFKPSLIPFIPNLFSSVSFCFIFHSFLHTVLFPPHQLPLHTLPLPTPLFHSPPFLPVWLLGSSCVLLRVMKLIYLAWPLLSPQSTVKKFFKSFSSGNFFQLLNLPVTLHKIILKVSL